MRLLSIPPWHMPEDNRCYLFLYNCVDRWQLELTFLLSHAFVLPGTTEQHQPHPLSDPELRESSDEQIIGLRLRPQPSSRESWLRLSSLTAWYCLGGYAAIHSQRMGQWTIQDAREWNLWVGQTTTIPGKCLKIRLRSTRKVQRMRNAPIL